MTVFTRRISPAGLNALHAMANEDRGNWWKDLLSLWRPSGQPVGSYGLRLAIRNGYLNFYFKGQSIARVCFGRGGAPRVETHVKYVANDQKDQKHAHLTGKTVTLPNDGQTLPYDGVNTLKEWIRRASEYMTYEKPFVDELVAANQSVLDLEVGLPAWDGRKSALRVDLVTLTKASDGAHLTFWEAKLISDSRLRSHKDPEVLKQIADYEAFLNYDGHSQAVEVAYRESCSLLVEFKHMAEQNGRSDISLDKSVIEVATNKSLIRIDDHPIRLAILREVTKGGGCNWDEHEQKLKELGANFIVLDGVNPQDRRLPGVAG